jgi:hypothetical protein
MNLILKISFLIICLLKTNIYAIYSSDAATRYYLYQIHFRPRLLNEMPLFSLDEKLNQSYRKLVYGEGFSTTQSFLEYRALMISRFLTEGDSMKIPEYIPVINRCIEHINDAIRKLKFYNGKNKEENLKYRLYVLRKLQQRVNEWRTRENFPHNLIYKEVIDFVTKTAIFTQKNNKDELGYIHGSDSYSILTDIIKKNKYIDFSYFVLDRYYTNVGSHQEYSEEHQKLLQKIKRPVLLPPFNSKQIPEKTWPFHYNTSPYLFFFIFTGEENISFDNFNPLRASHFIDIPGIKFNFSFHDDLLGYIKHDLTHLNAYIEDVLSLGLLEELASDSEDRNQRIYDYILKHAGALGHTWDRIKEFLEEKSDVNIPPNILAFFINYFYDRYHEKSEYSKQFDLKLIAISPESIEHYLISFIKEYCTSAFKDQTDKEISISEYIKKMKYFFAERKFQSSSKETVLLK